MAPLYKEFKKHNKVFNTKICITAQHRKMLDQVLDFFNITPDYDLNIMKPNQNLFELTADIIKNLKCVLEEFNPEFVFVHGDTTTTMASSIASFYAGAKVCHIEAGLRTNNKLSPFPEEINRQVASRICDYHFAPTEKSKENLLKENIKKSSVLVTGNTVIDALFKTLEIIDKNPTSKIKELHKIIKNQKLILVTGHRRENHGKGFENICKALNKIASNNKDYLIIYPVHLNPKVVNPVKRILGKTKNIILIEPLKYPDFIWLMNKSKIIITDSGGVQEEAPSLGKPVIVMRETTERPEAVSAGTVILVGTDTELITNKACELLNNPILYKKMSELHNPYGDGKACKRIVNFINNLSQ